MSKHNQPEDVRQADPQMPWNAPDPVGTYWCCETDKFAGDLVALHPKNGKIICEKCLKEYVWSEVRRLLAEEPGVLADALGFTTFITEPPEPPEDPNRP